MSDKQQTLRCQYGDGHDWQRPSQRGKPPRFCPEHKPAAEVHGEPDAEPDSGSANSEAASATPEAPKVNPFILKAQQQAEKEKQREKMASLSAAKAEKAEKRSEEEEARQRGLIEEELATIDGRVQESDAAYKAAYAKAMAINTTGEGFEKAWNKAEQAQGRLIRVLARKRWLEAHKNSDSETAEVTA